MATLGFEDYIEPLKVYLTRYREKYPDGQTMLACTLNPQAQSTTQDPLEEDMNMSFGRFAYFICPIFWRIILPASREGDETSAAENRESKAIQELSL